MELPVARLPACLEGYTLIILTRTDHSEALIVRGTGYDVNVPEFPQACLEGYTLAVLSDLHAGAPRMDYYAFGLIWIRNICFG